MRRTLVFPVVLAVLAACTLHQAAVAAGWLTIGRQSGDAPAGTTEVVIAALVALIAGSISLGVAGSRARLAPLVPPAAGAFVVARFYSFDPYYAPALRRMSDGGLVPGGLIYALILAAVVVAALMRKWPSTAPTGAAILVCSTLLALAEGAGH